MPHLQGLRPDPALQLGSSSPFLSSRTLHRIQAVHPGSGWATYDFCAWHVAHIHSQGRSHTHTPAIQGGWEHHQPHWIQEWWYHLLYSVSVPPFILPCIYQTSSSMLSAVINSLLFGSTPDKRANNHYAKRQQALSPLLASTFQDPQERSPTLLKLRISDNTAEWPESPSHDRPQ